MKIFKLILDQYNLQFILVQTKIDSQNILSKDDGTKSHLVIKYTS